MSFAAPIAALVPALIPALLLADPVLPEGPQVTVPSGQPVYLLEYVDETATEDAIFRARYVAPELAEMSEALETVLDDMEHLCNRQAIPNVLAAGLAPARIVVSLSAEPLGLGVIAPEVAQVFESYSLQDNTCIWELY
ncbi:MAG: acetolactate synthase [Rhodobacteraceae bacterium]|nr:MAG: acetolactate synthase [Paracoccaceae bacterium]